MIGIWLGAKYVNEGYFINKSELCKTYMKHHSFSVARTICIRKYFKVTIILIRSIDPIS